jgi:putative ABC transport system permease protein
MNNLPRGVERLLRIGLPADQREPIAGDLEEDFRARAGRDGRLRATIAIWWLAARVALTFRWEKTAYGRPLPPIADEAPRRFTVLESVTQDAVFAARLLRRQPGFTIVVVLMLALGIGANTAIFGVVDAVLWRPLAYPDAHEVMALAEQRPREGRFYGPVAPADFFDWRRDARSFAFMASYEDGAINLTGAGEPERLKILLASPGFLDVLRVPPAQGRDFRADEETIGRHRVALLSDALWRHRFGADPGVVGRSILLDGMPYDVIGVMPASFWWPSHPDVIVPLALDDHDRALRDAHFLDVIARLRPDVAESQAREELAVIGARLSQAYPVENRYHGPSIRTLRAALVGDVRTALLVLLGAVGFVLLIACANVATLLLARASGRQKELAVRRAVGATRGRLVQQMLIESVCVSLVGGAAGVLLAMWALTVLHAVLPAQFSMLPGIATMTIDARLLVATLGIALATGLGFGIVPALVVSEQRAATAINEESRGSSGSMKTRRLRATLVVAELALSLVLLAGAVLLIVSFNNLTDVAPGFRADGVVTVRLSLPYNRYGDHWQVVAFYDRVVERLGTSPGVQRVATTTAPPFSGSMSRLNLEIEHRTAQSPLPVRAHPRLVSPDYFSTMGIPLIRGRAFTDRDDESAPAVAIINESAARRYWPNEDPIGQRISLGATTDWREIVGIVGDVKQQALESGVEPEASMPRRQIFTSLGNGYERATTTLIVRTSSGDPMSVIPLVRAAVSSVDPLQPLGEIRTMATLIAESVAPRRLNFVLVSAFAFVALVLSATGLYGVMAYLVAQRTREIGVRMALGATPRQVVGLVLRQAGAMTAVGIALGIAGALAVTRSISSMLFGISAADPRVYAGVSLLLGVVALLAVAVPSSRATRVDPITALHEP